MRRGVVFGCYPVEDEDTEEDFGGYIRSLMGPEMERRGTYCLCCSTLGKTNLAPR
jgi:hypothetical protein